MGTQDAVHFMIAKKQKHPLLSLRSVGPATLQDLQMLGIDSISQLAEADPQDLYDNLCALTGSKQDICVFDTFCCAIAQAQNPDLPDEQKEWSWWSRQRLKDKLTR